jgi:hypothetical protein
MPPVVLVRVYSVIGVVVSAPPELLRISRAWRSTAVTVVSGSSVEWVEPLP